MKAPGTHFISKQVIAYEFIAIVSIIALIWLDELIESFIRDRSEAEFSHSICPECAKKLYPEFNS